MFGDTPPSAADLRTLGFDFSRTFGVELEFYSNDYSRDEMAANLSQSTGLEVTSLEYHDAHDDSMGWKIVSDGSLDDSEYRDDDGEYDCDNCEMNSSRCDNDCSEHCEPNESYSTRHGMELVTPGNADALRGTAGIADLWNVCKALNRTYPEVDSTCGLHVHSAAGDFKLPQFQQLARLYLKYEDTLDGLILPARRNGGNCHVRSLTDGYTGTAHEIVARIDSADSLYDICRNWRDRYTTLNLYSYEQHGTAEIRQHEGTTDFERILCWLILTQRILNASFGEPLTAADFADDTLPSLPALMDALQAPLQLRSYWQTIGDDYAEQYRRDLARREEVRIQQAEYEARRQARMREDERVQRLARREFAIVRQAVADETPPSFAPMPVRYPDRFRLAESVEAMTYNEMNAESIAENARLDAERNAARVIRAAEDRNWRHVARVERRERALCSAA